MPFSAVLDHQKTALQAVAHNKLTYKIPDDSRDYKPFDCFILTNAPAYVVIMYYVPGKKEFVMIDIDTFLKEEASSTRKSLTEERAKEIGDVFSF